VNPPALVPEDGEVVLVVDDNDPLRESLIRMLKSAGIRSVGASSVQDALRLQAVHLPVVAVVDERLPDGSGSEFAHVIKEHNPDTLVIILTGHATLETAVEAVGQFYAYLVKPVAPQVFLQTVEDALARRRAVAENRSLVEQLERRNAYQALHDPLTGLANRTLLDDRLGQALADCQGTGLSLGVLFIDLDEFKLVNDLFGHEVGDHLLRDMSDRLVDSCRPSDSVARFGGDEFVVVCPVKVSADACHIAAYLLEKLAEPTTIEGVEHRMTASIGIAVTASGTSQQSAETLLRDADTAMNRAKEAGRARWELFDSAMRDRVMERFEIERGLRNAFEDGGFEPVRESWKL
jgi:diguanylate cyclase (GGDEF)-like protein